MILRPATDADLPAITAIMNAAIARTTAVWSETPMTLADMRSWLGARGAGGFPVIVAEDAGAPVGYGSYGTFRSRDGYRLTVEHSVHVAETARGRGIGTALVERLIAEATAAGLHTMIGGIDGSNAGAIRLHQRLGFREVGRLPEVGRKLGRWLDLVLMQRLL